MKAWQLNPRDSTLNQNRNCDVGNNQGQRRFQNLPKDWQSNLINDIHVEKLRQKVIEFENLSTQIRINLDL